MTPEECLKQADIGCALLSLQDQVRAKPSNAEYRIFLFQLLAVMGQWERALTQLNVAGDLDDGALAMVTMYRDVLNCEAFREEVFKGNKEPVVFGNPEEWVALMIQALKLTASGRHDKALDLRSQALEAVPETAGDIDGNAFAWIADADSRLGPILEVIVDGRYLWVPFHQIATIVVEPPQDLRDMVWLPAHFVWLNRGESYGLIPTRYPLSYEDSDPLVTLSRKTVWRECGDNTYLGMGQRMLCTDINEYPLMDVRTVNLHSSEAGETEQQGNTDG